MLPSLHVQHSVFIGFIINGSQFCLLSYFWIIHLLPIRSPSTATLVVSDFKSRPASDCRTFHRWSTILRNLNLNAIQRNDLVQEKLSSYHSNCDASAIVSGSLAPFVSGKVTSSNPTNSDGIPMMIIGNRSDTTRPFTNITSRNTRM